MKLILKHDKLLIPLSAVNIALSAARPFPVILLPSFIVRYIGEHRMFADFIFLILAFSALILFINLAISWIQRTLNVRKEKLKLELRLELTRKVMRFNFEDVSTQTTLDNKTMAEQALDRFALLLDGVLGMASSVLTAVAACVVVAGIELPIVFIMLAGIILNGVYSKLNKKRQYIHSTEMAKRRRRFYYLYDLFSNFDYAKELRIFQMTDKFDSTLDELTDEGYRQTKEVFKFSRLSGYVSCLATFALYLAVYIFLGYRVLVSGTIDYADFVYLSGLAIQLSSSVSDTINQFLDYKTNINYFRSYFDFLDTECRLEEIKPIINIKSDKYEIVFKNVGFKYPGQDDFALRNLSLTIKSGEIIGIVGENGAGKTTFIKLLLGLYVPTEGNIFINGHNINEFGCDTMSSLFSAVFQDFKIFALSIKDNITTLDENADENKIQELLEKVRLNERIESLPHGLDTSMYRIFDEAGVQLSGGEEQKLAIVRALSKASDILLLDEPTSALDVKAESDIYDLVSKLSQNKLTIFISHRLASTKFCDRILVFSKGELVQDGGHRELLAADGLYKELYSLQSQFYTTTADGAAM
jgi:ABC-type multidrug transport system fused ATPase/permease subunit